ncbi:MAG: hypothetical protein GX079_05735 [Tissierellia bacterium]|nr:hypothetical protein [Synergistaceae bacterium]NLY73174.1 hypothetical protein [Tissierellia bacterium]
MSQKSKTILSVLLFMPVYFLLYTFFHEMGHLLVVVACGGTIENFVFWNLAAQVSYSGGTFTPLTAALNHAAGMLLPVLIGALAIGFYKPSVEFLGYHTCHLIVFTGLLSSMLVWLAFPIASLFISLPQGEDVSKFLEVTKLHPLIVASGTLCLVGAFVFWARAKGLLTKETLVKIRGEFK